MKVGQLVAEKIRLMDEQIKFLEFAWLRFTASEQNLIKGDYLGKVPDKYKS